MPPPTNSQQNYGLSAEVIDLRAAIPLNYDTLVKSVRKTGKVLLACDAVERGCVMQTVAATLTQLCFDDLDAPPVVLGSRNWITPAAELEASFFPQTRLAAGRDPRAHSAVEELPAGHESDSGRTRPAHAAGHIKARVPTT